MSNDRRYPYRDFREAALDAFLGGRNVVSARILPEGKNNSNYLLALSDGTCCILRLYSRATPGKECHVLRLVEGCVPVPVMQYQGDDFAVFTWLPGVPLHEVPAYAGEAAMALARIGTIRFAAPGQIHADGRVTPWVFGGDGDFTGTMLRNAEVLRWLGIDRVAAIRRIMAREAPLLAEIGSERVLVHGDYNPSNILIHEGRVAGVLDWEYAMSGTPYMDIGNLMRHLPECHHAAIESGLRAGGMALPADWRQRAWLVDVSSQLEFLTSARADAFKRQCVARIDAFIAAFGLEC